MLKVVFVSLGVHLLLMDHRTSGTNQTATFNLVPEWSSRSVQMLATSNATVLDPVTLMRQIINTGPGGTPTAGSPPISSIAIATAAITTVYVLFKKLVLSLGVFFKIVILPGIMAVMTLVVLAGGAFYVICAISDCQKGLDSVWRYSPTDDNNTGADATNNRISDIFDTLTSFLSEIESGFRKLRAES